MRLLSIEKPMPYDRYLRQILALPPFEAIKLSLLLRMHPVFKVLRNLRTLLLIFIIVSVFFKFYRIDVTLIRKK
jgi:hypothetical protein